MSIGPLGGLAAAAAGSPLAQSKGSDVEKTQEETAAEQRRLDSDKRAQKASGVGETDGEDHETTERNPDGRQPWHGTPCAPPTGSTPDPTPSQDATEQRGNLIDLSG